ncbi:hypothetical protein Daus18300_010767 [Diaporthe australafricana]|uniref:Uncharacterized protein n=1 Tax=Diaporthe australafricana TaxID=127596 RepID=A0ABR3W9E8_9PEZI
MASTALSQSQCATGIRSFVLNEMRAQKTWSGGDIQDGSKDPAATRFRFKIDTDIHEVYREAEHVFRFKLIARIAIVHNDKSATSRLAIIEHQRDVAKEDLRHLSLFGNSEQMNHRSDWYVHLLDSMQQRDSAEDVIRDLRKLLEVSAYNRQEVTAPSQSHWGLQNFTDKCVDRDIIGDAVLEMIRHLKTTWLHQKGLASLKDMPTHSKHLGAKPSIISLMDASEAFCAVVIDTGLYFQLDE